MAIRRLGVAALIFSLRALQQNGAAETPEFAVETAAGVWHYYSNYPDISAKQFVVSDGIVTANVTLAGQNLWRLEILANQDLHKVVFPWRTRRVRLNDDINNTYFYYPYLLGMTEKAAAHDTDWSWWGLIYPGEAFAPLVILADKTRGRVVAAANWPPREVKPMYAAARIILEYDSGLRSGIKAAYQALIADISGDAGNGSPPWQAALDLYRLWLDSNLKPPAYPDWMWKGQGILNIQLQNYPSFDINVVARTWDSVKTRFPWVLFWGQMGPYAMEGGGCCLLKHKMDPRYQPDLPSWAAARVAEGNHVGYYSAPYYRTGASDPLHLDTSVGLSYLSDWLSANRRYGANSFYIDTLASSYQGQPAALLSLFAIGTLPADSLIEGTVDIYSAASLVSGSLVGTSTLCGAPYKRPEDAQFATFPRLGRYLMNDRLIYEGGSNTDWRFWGGSRAWLKDTDNRYSTGCDYAAYCSSGKPCEHGTERLAFLLGAKIDLLDSAKNAVLDAIIEERERLHWWDRRPVYMDTKGLDLTGIPKDSYIEAARFTDRFGTDLIAISNPLHKAGLFIGLGRKRLPVSTRGVYIAEVQDYR